MSRPAEPPKRALSRSLSLVSAGVLAAAAAGCGGAPSKAAAPAAKGAASPSASAVAKAPKSMDPPGLAVMVDGSVLLPELMPEKGVILREEGHKKMLVDRMRLIVHENGAIERATELLPNAYASASALPSRLGGGFLFQSSGGGTTQLWRAASWLAKLEPLTRISPVADEITAGFDRLYVRHQSSNRLSAIDPQSGAVVPLGPLPPSVSYGQLAFADGWRAVVDTDLRGPLVTFDAGTTWRPVVLPERPSAITAVTGDPMLYVSAGKYVIDAAGGMRFLPDDPPKTRTDKDDEADATKLGRPPGPLGKKPLRAALEDGFPDEGRSAIVARGGALARVSLRDGAVTRIVEEAYRDREASCHAVRVGKGWGFVCGQRDGATSVLAFKAPFSLEEVWRFDKPRFVSASGNGALVARGPCAEEPAAATPTSGRTYCIRAIDGTNKQVRVTGDLGVERVIALTDGRVVVLVPPRREVGQITVLKGTSVESSAALKIPQRPSDASKTAKRGLWLDGFEEREPGVIGGWVEAGGAVVGVRVSLNGEVKLGELRTDPNGPLLAGRFGVSLGDDGEAAESTDGGMTWTSFEVPDHEIDAPSRTRACGPVGCALASWLRVGWGKPLAKDDFSTAKSPTTPYASLRTPSTVSMTCELLGSVTPPLPEKKLAKNEVKPTVPPYPRYGYGHYGYGYGRGYQPAWAVFRNTAAPVLGKDEVGVDTGTYGDVAAVRSYAWGKKGADWTKVGKWLVRFDDRFDTGGGVRSTATTLAPWADEAAATSGVPGGMSYGVMSWTLYPEGSGRAALAQACNGPCALYSLVEGQPPLKLRDGSGKLGTYQRVLAASGTSSGGAVRIGESWFFLTQGATSTMSRGSYRPGAGHQSLDLWRSDLGVVRHLGVYFRPAWRYAALEAPRLVRRASGSGLGLLVTAPRGPTDPSTMWHVLPLDPETGAIQEPILLGRRDLAGVMPERCAPGQDGWLVDTPLEMTPSIDLGTAYAPMDGIELRLRIDPGSTCADGVAARIDGVLVTPKKTAGKPRDVDARKVPLAATERASGTRWVLECGPTSNPSRNVMPPPVVDVVREEEDD